MILIVGIILKTWKWYLLRLLKGLLQFFTAGCKNKCFHLILEKNLVKIFVLLFSRWRKNRSTPTHSNSTKMTYRAEGCAITNKDQFRQPFSSLMTLFLNNFSFANACWNWPSPVINVTFYSVTSFCAIGVCRSWAFLTARFWANFLLRFGRKHLFGTTYWKNAAPFAY